MTPAHMYLLVWALNWNRIERSEKLDCSKRHRRRRQQEQRRYSIIRIIVGQRATRTTTTTVQQTLVKVIGTSEKKTRHTTKFTCWFQVCKHTNNNRLIARTAGQKDGDDKRRHIQSLNNLFRLVRIPNICLYIFFFWCVLGVAHVSLSLCKRVCVYTNNNNGSGCGKSVDTHTQNIQNVKMTFVVVFVV